MGHTKTNGSQDPTKPKENIVLKKIALLAVTLLSGCAAQTAYVYSPVPPTSKIAMIELSDCNIPNHEDCIGSGKKATKQYSDILSLSVLPRPSNIKINEDVPTSGAVEVAKSKGFDYILFGTVTDIYDVAPMTFRLDRAGVNIRIAKVADGSIAVLQNIPSRNAGSNLSTPEGMFEDFAKEMKEVIK